VTHAGVDRVSGANAACLVAIERGARDFDQAAKESIARRGGSQGLSEASGGFKCASVDAPDQRLSVGVGIGRKSAAAPQHAWPCGIGPQLAQSRRAQQLRSLGREHLAPFGDDMFSEEDAALLVLTSYRQEFPCDPAQQMLVSDSEAARCEVSGDEHGPRKLRHRFAGLKQSDLLELAI
jgi:hypothetical protein